MIRVAAEGALPAGGGISLLLRLPVAISLWALKSLLASQVTAVLKHVAGVGVEGPERALSRLVRGARDFDKAVVETQGMTDGVLPPLLILPVERKQVHDKLVNLT